jgi:hypothetical protein
MRHFFYEEKEYRFNPRFKRRRDEGDSAAALAGLLRRKGGSGGSRRGSGRTVDARQQCVVKAQYSKSIEAHRVQLETYLVREGTGVDGNGAKLYGTDIEEYRAHMAATNFRIFLSPQRGDLDLTTLAERFVEKLELQTGYRLYWQGANHYNTAHPHAHLLINGTDRNGREVRLPRDVIKTFMRETARDICTDVAGPRTREEIALDREKEPDAPRYTRLDKTIGVLCDENGRVNPGGIRTGRERIRRRLEALRKMKLCVFKDGEYHLSPRWKDDLQANGRYNAFLQARDCLGFAAPSRLRLYSGAEGIVTGRVARVFRTDGDASDNHALVVEGIDGGAYFVPLFKRPEMRDGERKTVPQEGDFLTIKPHANQRGRLTPVLFKREEKAVRQEIRHNRHEGKLAEAVLRGTYGHEEVAR